MSAKRVESPTGNVSYWFWCEGCNTHHAYTTKLAEGEKGPVWTKTGSDDKPTFRASLLCNGRLCMCESPTCKKKHPDPERGYHRCHLFVTDGMVNYLSDCSHRLKGQTVPLQPPRF